MRIAFFGLPLAALLLAHDGHTIAYAAVCRRGAIGTRRLRRRLSGTGAPVDPVPDLSRPAVLARVRAARPDLLVSWFWTTRIPEPILAIAPGFGVHPSLLPRHRGPDPYFWAIDAGDPVTGVTAHRLAPEYDTGALLGHRTLRIDPAWNAWTLAKKLDRPSLALLRETAGAYASGRPPAEIPQDDAQATLAPAPDDAMLELRWTWDAAKIVRRIRAASPWPGAYTLVGDVPVVVTRARATRDFPRALAPGEAAVRPDGTAVVRAGDDAVELLQGWREDDEQPVDRGDFATLVRLAETSTDPNPGENA